MRIHMDIPVCEFELKLRYYTTIECNLKKVYHNLENRLFRIYRRKENAAKGKIR